MNRATGIILQLLVMASGLISGSVFAQEDSSTKAVELATLRGVESQSAFQRWIEEKPGGLYNNTSFAVVSGRGNLFSGMQTAFGYKFNPHLGLGGGAGIERFTNLPTYSYYKGNFTFLPVFAEFRYTVLKARFSPVAALQGGYKFLINTPTTQMDEWLEWIYPPIAWNYYYNYDTYHKGGPFATLEIGVNAKMSKRFGIYASADYSIWSVSGTNHYWIYQATSTGPGQTSAIATEYTRNVLAYQSILMFRLGFTF